jgi:polyisoprenoid-binding protein YceI
MPHLNGKMKKILFLLILISTQTFAQRKFELNAQSQVTWKGSMVVGGAHEGTITPMAGSFLTTPDGKISKGNITIDMNSITSNDVKPAKSAKELEDHLKSPDFFDVIKFPQAFFTIVSVTPSTTYPNKGNYVVTGLLMIKGISNKIVFPANVMIGMGYANVKGVFQFDRTKWDIIYHSASFFAGAKNELISDQINMLIDLNFVEKK